MPVTAKLSKAAYERLGEEVINQLVDWFNQVDGAYRADLRQFNELNFSRVDAKLETFEAKLNGRIDSLDSKLGAMQAAIIAHMEKRLNDQTRFFFLAWAALFAPIMALWFR